MASQLFSDEETPSCISVDQPETLDMQLLSQNNFTTPQQQMPSDSASPSLSQFFRDDDEDDAFAPASFSIKAKSIGVKKKKFKFRKPSTQDRAPFSTNTSNGKWRKSTKPQSGQSTWTCTSRTPTPIITRTPSTQPLQQPTPISTTPSTPPPPRTPSTQPP